MIDRYVRRAGQWVNKATGKPMDVPNRIVAPRVQSDTPAYLSVVSNKMIDGRRDRREDLKRSGCREVDPSENTITTCQTEKWAKRLNLPHVPVKPAAYMPTTIGPDKP